MTRLPQLEQELVAAAGRLGSPRRMVAPATRALLAAAAAALAVAAAAIVIAGNGGDASREAVGPAFPADAQLEELMGVFREPATPADRVTYAPDDPRLLADRQPGEDPSQSRRVDSAGDEIFVWPMRDGVCYGVPSGSGCVPLDHLRRVGVSVGVQSGRHGLSVAGVAVDGIDEVVLTSPGRADQRVPVRENFVLALVDRKVETVRWTFAGEERSLDIAHVADKVAPPKPTTDAIAESVSAPVDFAMGRYSYRAVGFQTTRSALCVTLTQVDSGVPGVVSCLKGPGLRETLAEKPITVFGAGGTHSGDMVHAGFARPDVVEVTPRDEASDVTVVVSKPWRPEPWDGEPIRFLLAVDVGSGMPERGKPLRVELNARLADGRVLPVP
jgi:hypothetical protein